MKKILKSAISVALCFIMVLGAVAVGVTASAANSEYSVGDIVKYGTYPQSKVTDSATISALNAAGGNWVSYGYYSGTGSYGSMTPSDYMKYKDVSYNGNKYRAVTFDSYRVSDNTKASSVDNSKQDDNGYTTGNTYWFKYEPINWRVLDPSTGLVMCATIIDSQPFNNYIVSGGTDEYDNSAYWSDSSKTHYANNYPNSSIRQWLNDDFYNTAFSADEKADIATTTIDNSAYSTAYSAYDSASVSDKVFLLSWNEALDSKSGFDTSNKTYDPSRRLMGSDYAKSQGLYVFRKSGSDYDGCSSWLLRTPGNHPRSMCYVSNGGNIASYSLACDTSYGVAPALKIQNLKPSDNESGNEPDSPSSGGNTNKTINAKINVAAEKTVDYKSKVIITATATDAPKGYTLVMTVNGKEIKGTNTEVTCEIGQLTSDIEYSVKIVDSKGIIQKDASGKDLTKDGGKITCNASFFKKIIAFFKGLFGSLPTVTIKP